MQTRKLIRLSLLVALAGVLHWLEGLFPVPLPVPGLKLGLANIISVLAIVLYGWKEALCIAITRVILGTMISGLFLGLPFLLGLAGAVAACLTMFMVLKLANPLFSLAGVSIIGAVTHNLAQLVTAAWVVHSPELLYYLPFLVLLAIPAGLATGYTAMFVLKKLPDTIR